MAIATEKQPSESEHQYVDFDEYVNFHLHRTQSGIKSSEILTTLGWIVTVGLAYLLTFTVFDHWFIDGGFTAHARLLMLVVIVSGGLAWGGWRVVLPYLKRVNALYAAREIEKAAPELKGGMLNLVDLQNAGRKIPDHVRVAIEKRAAVELSKVDIDQAVDRQPLMRVSYLLLFVVTACCLYTVFSSKNTLASVKRAVLPTSNTAPPTETRITGVQPGNVSVVARSSVLATAIIKGQIPEDVILYFSTRDGKYVDEPIKMLREKEGLPTFAASLTGENARGLLQDVIYRIEAGDAATENYTVKVVQPPSAQVVSVDYVYPQYTRLIKRTDTIGHLSAIEGTTVVIQAKTNIPVETAEIVYVEEDQPTGEKFPMQVGENNQLSVEMKLEIRSDGTQPSHYWIQCKTEDGLTDPNPTRYNITIVPDEPPNLRLLAPNHDLQMPANGTVPIQFHAEDPDFELRSLKLMYSKDGEIFAAEPPLVEEENLGRSVRASYDWKLEPLVLETGDRLQFWLEAKDNRRPLANKTPTAKLNIEIVDAVSEEEADKQLQEEKKKQKEDLEEPAEEEQQQPEQNPENSDPSQEKTEGASEEGEGQGESQTDDGDGEQTEDGTAENDSDGETGEESSDSQDGNDSAAKEESLDPDNPEDAEKALKKILDHQREQKDQEDKQQKKDESSDSDAKDKSEDPQTERPKDESSGSDPEGEKQPQDDAEQAAGDQEKSPEGESSSDPKANQGDKEEAGNDSKVGAGEKGENSGASGEDSNSGDKSDSEDPAEGDKGAPSKDPQEPPQQKGEGDGESVDKPKKSDDPAQQKDDVQGEEQPADLDDSVEAEKKPATGEEEGKAQATDQEDAEKAKKQIDREGEKNEAGRKPGDPESEPQTQEKGDSDDPAKSEAKPKSGDPQEKQSDDPKGDQQKEDQKSKDSEKKTKPEGKPENSGEPPKGQGEEDQKSQQPEEGEKGESTQGEKGESGSQEPGAGEDNPQQNDADASGKPSAEENKGKPSQEPGKASPKGEEGGKPSTESQPSQDGPSQEGQSEKPGEKQGQSSTGGKPDQSSKEGPPPKGGGTDQAADQNGKSQKGSGDGEGEPAPFEPEKANEEYAKKATNLVLDKLKDQLERGEADKALKEKLGWTDEQLKEFIDKTQQKMDDDSEDQSPTAEASRRQFMEMLKDLNPSPEAKKRASAFKKQTRVNKIDKKSHSDVPLRYRGRYGAFTRSLADSPAAKSKGPAKKSVPKK